MDWPLDGHDQCANVTYEHRVNDPGNYNWCPVPDHGYDAILFAAVAVIATCLLSGRMSLISVLLCGMATEVVVFNFNMAWFGNAVTLWLGMSPAELFFYAFLPPLLFDSAIRIDFFIFRKVMVPVLVFAFLVVAAMTAILTPLMLYGFNLQAVGWHWTHAVLFCAMVASTDAVAVTAILKQGGGPEQLATLMEGESLFNDATSIVLFEMFLEKVVEVAKHGGDLSEPLLTTMAIMMRDMAYLAVGGALVGLLFGLLTSLILRLLRWRGLKESVQVCVTLGLAYLCFYIGNGPLQVSGVIAVVVYGLHGAWTLKWGLASMQKGEELFVEFWEIVSFAVNGLVFFYAGVSATNFFIRSSDLLSHSGGTESLATTLWRVPLVYISLFVIRGLCIAAFAPMLSAMGSPLDWQGVAFVTWGGLRGALSLIMAQTVVQNREIASSDPGDNTLEYVKAEISLWTAGICVCTLLINAPSIPLALKALQLDQVSVMKLRMRAKARRALIRFTDSAINDLQHDEDEMLQGVDWKAVKTFFDDLGHRLRPMIAPNDGSDSASKSRRRYAQLLTTSGTHASSMPRYSSPKSQGALMEPLLLDQRLESKDVSELDSGEPSFRAGFGLSAQRIPEMVQLPAAESHGMASEGARSAYSEAQSDSRSLQRADTLRKVEALDKEREVMVGDGLDTDCMMTIAQKLDSRTSRRTTLENRRRVSDLWQEAAEASEPAPSPTAAPMAGRMPRRAACLLPPELVVPKATLVYAAAAAGAASGSKTSGGRGAEAGAAAAAAPAPLMLPARSPADEENDKSLAMYMSLRMSRVLQQSSGMSESSSTSQAVAAAAIPPMSRVYVVDRSAQDRASSSSPQGPSTEDPERTQGGSPGRQGEGGNAAALQKSLSVEWHGSKFCSEWERMQYELAAARGQQKKWDDQVLAEARLRLISGFKRYFHAKAMEGLLSSRGLKILKHACDLGMDTPLRSLEIWSHVLKELNSGWLLVALARLQFWIRRSTISRKGCCAFGAGLLQAPLRRLARWIGDMLSRHMVVSLEVAVEYYMALFHAPQAQWLRLQEKLTSHQFSLMAEIEAESALVWQHVIDRQVEAPERFQAIQSWRAAMAIVKQQAGFVEELFESGMIEETEMELMLAPVEEKQRILEVHGPIWRPPLVSQMLRSVSFLSSSVVPEDLFEWIISQGSLRICETGQVVLPASDDDELWQGWPSDLGIVISGVVKSTVVAEGAELEMYAGMGAVIGLLPALCSMRMAGLGTAMAEGNALGRGATMFIIPQQVLQHLAEEATAGGREQQQLVLAMHQFAASIVVERVASALVDLLVEHFERQEAPVMLEQVRQQGLHKGRPSMAKSHAAPKSPALAQQVRARARWTQVMDRVFSEMHSNRLGQEGGCEEDSGEAESAEQSPTSAASGQGDAPGESLRNEELSNAQALVARARENLESVHEPAVLEMAKSQLGISEAAKLLMRVRRKAHSLALKFMADFQLDLRSAELLMVPAGGSITQCSSMVLMKGSLKPVVPDKKEPWNVYHAPHVLAWLSCDAEAFTQYRAGSEGCKIIVCSFPGDADASSDGAGDAGLPHSADSGEVVAPDDPFGSGPSLQRRPTGTLMRVTSNHVLPPHHNGTNVDG